MSGQIPISDNLWPLLNAVCDGTLVETQVQELATLLDSDSAIRRLFLDHVQLRRNIRLLGRSQRVRDLGIARVRATLPQTSPPTAPIPGFFGTTLHGTIGYFSEGMPLAYLLATVIVGVGLLIGAFMHVSSPVQVASGEKGAGPLCQNGPKDAPLPSPLSPLPSTVGRITGMVDCQWESSIHPSSFILHPSSPVSLGDTFALSSGLLEITYDTGAKVILQGPVTYAVESATGGFLSVGKLTARMEKKEEGRTKNEELSASRSSFLIPHSYFAVRTPTATVTDLGTEFGVEVSKQGATTSHVFRGVVEVRRVIDHRATGDPIRLTESESVQVTGQNDDELSANRSTTAPTDFVRSEQLKQLIRDQQSKLVCTPPLRWPLLDKTLVAWVSLDNLEQQGVGIFSIVNMPEFDGIVFGELERGRWMAGSHEWARTQKDRSAYPAETAGVGELVQIAIVYNWTQITIYRNGVKYAEYDAGSRQVFKKDSILLMGRRHLPNGAISPFPTLVGAIEEARFYNFAMPAEMIAKLKLGEPSQIRPVGQWTFEDGTARDVTGHFPMGELQGNACINDGKLILDGAESYLVVPAAEKPSKQPSVGAEANPKSHNASQ